MEMVVDTSAVLAVLLREPSRPSVLSATAGATLIAPPTLQWEIGNALGAMFKRKSLSLDAAIHVVSDFASLPIAVRPISLEAAVRAASLLNVYTYDAYLLVCAQAYGLPLLTLDRGMRDAARRGGIELVEVKP